tara:strand:+ start:1737 stop:2258 length:522 start_codon:yes stop_codon:yes gene_type:complete
MSKETGNIHPKNRGRKTGRHSSVGRTGGRTIRTRDPRTPHGAQHQWGTPMDGPAGTFNWGWMWGQPMSTGNWQCTGWVPTSCDCTCIWSQNLMTMPNGEICSPNEGPGPNIDYTCYSQWIGGETAMICTHTRHDVSNNSCFNDSDCQSECVGYCSSQISGTCNYQGTMPYGGH